LSVDIVDNIETFFFDESGTPADAMTDGLFITGGIVIRGDTRQIAHKWNDFIIKNSLAGKSRYNKKHLFVPLQFNRIFFL
jgi:hypothetical protein